MSDRYRAEDLRVVGRRLPKVDSVDKVTGRAQYVDDLRFGRPLFARLVRSLEPHARIVSIDDRAARAVPGVVEILSHQNLGALLPGLAGSFDPACHDFEREEPFAPQPGDASVFTGTVRFVGDPVAVVVAESADALAEAVGLVDVEYEPRAALLTPDQAAADGAPLLHDGAVENVASRASFVHGECDEAMAGSAGVIRQRFQTSKQKQAQMEPTSCVAALVDGVVTVWSPMQSPHRARHTLAHLFGLPLTRMRVIAPTIGGAFGKGDALTAEPYAIASAMVTGRPVRLTYSRTEDFVGTESRHPTTSDVVAGFDREGRLIALRAKVVLDAGAYLSHSPRIALVFAKQLFEMYAIPNIDIEVTVSFTNLPVSGAFRGYGGPQAAYILEHVIDLGARMLGLDPVDMRLTMLRDAEGVDSVSRLNVVACLERGRERLDPRATKHTPGKLRGVGVACVNWKSGVADKPGALDRSAASVRVNEDATVDVVSGACDLGTGVSTTLAQVVAEVMSLPIASVRVIATDTATTPFDSGAFSSRSLFRAGRAAVMAAHDARGKIVTYAAELLEAPVDDVVLSDGFVTLRGVPSVRMPLTEVLHRGLMSRQTFTGEGEAPSVGARSACAQLAEVEVDPETGQVDVLRLVAVQEVGRAINPAIVEGQIEGGVYQGLGYALTEDLQADPDSGALLTGTFMDYRIPTVKDGPRVETVVIEMPDDEGPFGAKGVAEPSIILTAPAIANAILAAAGVCPTTLPMTPERVHEALLAARHRSGSTFTI